MGDSPRSQGSPLGGGGRGATAAAAGVPSFETATAAAAAAQSVPLVPASPSSTSRNTTPLSKLNAAAGGNHGGNHNNSALDFFNELANLDVLGEGGEGREPHQPWLSPPPPPLPPAPLNKAAMATNQPPRAATSMATGGGVQGSLSTVKPPVSRVAVVVAPSSSLPQPQANPANGATATPRLLQCPIGSTYEQHNGIYYVYTSTVGAFGFGRYLVGPLAYINADGTCMVYDIYAPGGGLGGGGAGGGAGAGAGAGGGGGG